jgi:hypothetical protein
VGLGEGKMIKRLLFNNPQFHVGSNVTVRRGDKWFNNVKVGDTLEFCATQFPEDVISSAKVTGLAYIPFMLMPDFWFTLEHDSSCITFDGLLKAMDEAYPGFSIAEMVTVIIFEMSR